MKKINIIESLRAIAAISVCLFHFVCTTIGLFNREELPAIFSYGKYGVHVFFVISGFIIPYSMYLSKYNIKALPQFLLKSFIRIEPPYLVSILLVISLISLKHFAHIGVDQYDELSIKRVALHIGYLINFFSQYHWLNGVYWTLAIEFQYYIFIALSLFLFVHEKKYYRIVGYLLILLLNFLSSNVEHFPYYSFLFLIGIVTFSYKTNIIKQLEFWIVFVLSLVFLGIYINYVYAIVGAATALIIIYFTDVKIYLFDALGKISYSIYLIHPVIGGAIINVGSRHVSTTYERIALVCFGFIITLLSSYIMYLLIEKPSKIASSKINLS